MNKPVYKHQSFITHKEFERTETKRFSLELTLNENSEENLIVIMKNPSRATLEFSDKTVFNVCNYIYLNKGNKTELKNIGKIIILNLIPFFETYSNELVNLKSEIVCSENMKRINKFASENSKVIIAWGNHPTGLSKEYETLKEKVFEILKNNKNEIFYVDKMSKNGNPKHAQVWSYENELKKFARK